MNGAKKRAALDSAPRSAVEKGQANPTGANVMHQYQEALTAIVNHTTLKLAAAREDKIYWQAALHRHHEIIGMIELARRLDLPALMIAALEEHRDRLAVREEAQ